MHKIDLHNYEAWMLDAAEGKLSGEALEALHAFLAMHPELDTYDTEALPVLEPETVAFTHTLLKNESVCIEYVEGLLNPAQKKAVETDESLKQTLQLYKATLLSADLNVVFPDKKSLLKQHRVIALFNTKVFRAAAALFILAGLLWLLPDTSPVYKHLPFVAYHHSKGIVPKKNKAQFTQPLSSELLAHQSLHSGPTHALLNSSNLSVTPIITTTASSQNYDISIQPVEKDSLPTPVELQMPSILVQASNNESTPIANKAPETNASKTLYTSIDEIAIDNESEEEPTTNWNQYMTKKEKTRSKTIYGRILTIADNAIAAGKKALHFDNRPHGYAFAVRDLKVEKH